MTPLNLEVGMSSSEAQSLKGGPFSATQGDFIVGGSGSQSAPRTTATNWGLILLVVGLVVARK